MNKNKSIPTSNQLFSKKQPYNYSRLLNNSTNSNNNHSSHLDSTTIKSKQKTKNKPSSSSKKCEYNYNLNINNNKSGIDIQNYANKNKNKIKIKARNHNNSFTSYLSSDQLLWHLTNQQFTKQDISGFKENKSIQFNSTNKTFLALLNKSKQQNSVSMQKNIPYTSYCQFKRNLLGNTNKSKHMNKSAYFAEELKEDFISSSLITKLRKIESQMEEGLNKIKNLNEGNLLIKAKSYSVYKIAFEKVTQELPNEYVCVLNKIIDGYHQIVSVFISEHKKLIEYYEGPRTSKLIYYFI